MRTLTWCLASFVSVLVAPAVIAQDRGLAIEYSVKVADIPGQLFHVTIVSVAGQTLEGQGSGTIFRLLNEKLGRNVRQAP